MEWIVLRVRTLMRHRSVSARQAKECGFSAGEPIVREKTSGSHREEAPVQSYFIFVQRPVMVPMAVTRSTREDPGTSPSSRPGSRVVTTALPM